MQHGEAAFRAVTGHSTSVRACDRGPASAVRISSCWHFCLLHPQDQLTVHAVHAACLRQHRTCALHWHTGWARYTAAVLGLGLGLRSRPRDGGSGSSKLMPGEKRTA